MLKMHLGDAREMLRDMASGSVDCIVTDPPYPVIGGGHGGSSDPLHIRPSGMLAANNGKIFEHNDTKFRDYMHDLFRVLRDPGHMYFMVNFLNLESALAEVRRSGFNIHNVLIARKQNATPNRWYMKNVEYVIFARKGAAFPINDCGDTTCHDWTNPVGKKSHPTEKSVALMQKYIENSTQPGETVLDPFAGSGATGIAARASERSFIGCEIDVTYYQIACNRIGIMPCL